MSVVVTCSSDVSCLSDCLGGLTTRCLAAGAEVVVVRAGSADDLASTVRRFPTLTYVAAPRGARMSELRHIGLLRSSASIVLFVDDAAPERRQWVEELCACWGEWVKTGGPVGAALPRTATTTHRPRLSVVMPVRNDGATLLTALEALALSDLSREQWELVVVDDASTDSSADIAAAFADRIVRLRGGARGPGYARNRGFELTLGHFITFVNADVMVRPDTLRRSMAALEKAPDVGAVFGCSDTRPLGRGVVSQYRSLVQHYYLRCNAGDAATFSSACGTVRSAVFQEAGGYDEWHFPRRQLEDLELGQRIRGLGHRIVLHTDILTTNLNQWTLRRMVGTEIFDRGVPWMRLVNRRFSPQKAGGRTLRSIKKVNTAFTWLAVLLLLAAWWMRQPLLAYGALACAMVVMANDRKQLSFFRRERGVAFAMVAALLGGIQYLAAGFGIALGWLARQTVGDPRPGPAAEAFAEMAVKGWPPAPAMRLMDRQLTVATEPPTPEVTLPPHRRPTPPGLLALGNEGTT